MMKLIILRRLLEIKDSLEQLIPQLDPETKVYKDAVSTLKRINRALSKIDISKLPKDVRVNTSKLKFRNGKLYGPVLMADARKVYYVIVEGSKIKDMKVYEGGISKMEYLENRLFH